MSRAAAWGSGASEMAEMRAMRAVPWALISGRWCCLMPPMAKTGTDVESVMALSEAGSLGIAEGQLGGGGVDGSEQDEVGAGLRGCVDFRRGMGRDADLPVRAEKFPGGFHGHGVGRQVHAGGIRGQRHVHPVVDEELGAVAVTQPLHVPGQLQQGRSAQVLFPELHGPDAAPQRLLQDPQQLAASSGLAVGDEIQVEVDGSQGAAAWRSLATSGQWRRPSIGLEAVA